MRCMHPAKRAILIELQLIRSLFFIFCRRIVSTLTCSTCKSYNISHLSIPYEKLPQPQKRLRQSMFSFNYSTISLITPAPTVRPPSRIAKRRPTSIAIGVMSSTAPAILSPGITISTPSARVTTPVTSVVLK